MKGHVAAFLSGLGIVAGAIFAYDIWQRRESGMEQRGTKPQRASDRATLEESRQPASALVDINTASGEQLASLGIADPDTLDRIIEHRPYRNKLDLVSQMVVTEDVYDLIKGRISVGGGADEGVKVAS